MANAPLRLLGDLTPAQFLAEYWQKKPMLVRGAFSEEIAPLSPEELAGIAMEEEAAARVILVRGGDAPWELRPGPFLEEDFSALPEANWTLLVQEVEQWHLGAADLLEVFRFIPNWRMDDLMVSYATPGGGVGAHIDNYDVFLVQGLGRRRWRIAREPVTEERLVPDLDVRILADFVPDEDWILNPGDMLYLPPRIAHEGVALEACMTYSVGFRAPSAADMIGAFLHYLSETVDSSIRYADPARAPATEPGLIDEEALEWLHDMIVTQISDADHFRRWFGQFVTEPKRGRFPELLDEPYHPSEIIEMLETGGSLRRTSVGHFAHMANTDRSISLFVGGTEFRLDADVASAASLIDGTGALTHGTIGSYAERPAFRTLLAELVNTGFLIPAFEEI